MIINDLLDYTLGQVNGQAHAQALARNEAALLEGRAARAQDEVEHLDRRLLMTTTLLGQEIGNWRARYTRERAARRGWKRHGMAASEIIGQLTGKDTDAVEKMVMDYAATQKDRLDAENERVDNKLFDLSDNS